MANKVKFMEMSPVHNLNMSDLAPNKLYRAESNFDIIFYGNFRYRSKIYAK